MSRVLLLGILIAIGLPAGGASGGNLDPDLPVEVLGLGEASQVKLGPGRMLGTCSGTGIHLWLLNGTLLSTFPARNGMPWCGFDWSPDGSMVAGVDYRGRITVARTANLSSIVLEIIHDYGHYYGTGGGSLVCWPLEWSPDGSLLAFGFGDETYLFNASSGELEAFLDEPSGTSEAGFIDWSPDGGRLAKSDMGTNLVYDTTTWEVVSRFTSDSHRMKPSVFSPDGNMLAVLPAITVKEDDSVSELQYYLNLLDPSTGELRSSTPLVGKPSDLAWHEEMIALGCGSDLLIMSARDGSVIANLSGIYGQRSPILSISWEEGVLASVSKDQLVRVWSVDNATDPPVFALDRTLRGWGSSIVVVEWFPDNQHLLSLDVAEGLPVVRPLTSQGPEGQVGPGGATWAGVSPDGRMLGTATQAEVSIWDAEYGSLAATIYPGLEAEFCRWNPRTPDLLAIVGASEIQVWDIGVGRDGNPVATISVPGRIKSVDWSPGDGGQMAIGWVASDGSMVEIWDPSRGSVLASAPTWRFIWSLAWSPDGTLLACLAGYDYHFNSAYDQENPPPAQCHMLYETTGVFLWSLAEGLAGPSMSLIDRGYLPRMGSAFRCQPSLSWAPNSTMIAAATGSQTGDYPSELSGHLAECGMSTPGVMIWSIDQEEGMTPLAGLVGPLRPVESVDWSPDGSKIAAGSQDGTISVWRVGPPQAMGEKTAYGFMLLVIIPALMLRYSLGGIACEQ